MEEIDIVRQQIEKVEPRLGEPSAKLAIDMIIEHHDAPEEFSEALLTFSNVLKSGKYKSEAYVKAVQYCQYRSINMSMVKSYRLTYPLRCFRDGKAKPTGTVDALASLYDKTKLVQSILAQMQIPLHIMMMGERVRAANVLAHLMIHGETDRIQMESADKLLNHIVPPETQKIELDIGIKTDDTIKELNTTLTKIADLAQDRIKAGLITPVEVIES